jgi:hypothetical protein
MSRPRKPTALLELNGAFAKNPSRRRERENEPVPEGPLGPPPEDWVKGAEHSQTFVELLKAWDEIVNEAPFGVLTSSDRDHVEATCYLKHKIRRAARGYGKCTSGDYAQLNKCLSQMGLIPSERSNVQGKKKQPEVANEWARLASQQRRPVRVK